MWQAFDPHATAGVVLLNAESQAILAGLLGEDVEKAAPESPRYQRLLAARCVSCHVTTTHAELATSPTIDTSFLRRGVGCESCHGAASEWVDSHYYVERVEERSQAGNLSQEKERQPEGMNKTKGWLARVDGCVRCHVGSRRADGLTRDMNHDLIAAGHPALRFDPYLYSSNLPPHWRPTSSLTHLKRFESGRLRSLMAAAALAIERMEDHQSPANHVPLPELSEYDCFSCHHDLQVDHDRGKTNNLGSADWNAWYSSGILAGRRYELLAIGTVTREESRAILAKVRDGTKKRSESILKQEGEASAGEGLLQLIEEGRQLSDWHDASVWYLRCSALLDDLSGSGEASLFSSSETLPLDAGSFADLRRKLERLTVATDGDSRDAPLFFGPEYEGPRYFSPAGFRASLDRLPVRKSLFPKGGRK